MILYMVVATFILMALVFGSIILPAKAIIMTALGPARRWASSPPCSSMASRACSASRRAR